MPKQPATADRPIVQHGKREKHFRQVSYGTEETYFWTTEQSPDKVIMSQRYIYICALLL